MEVMEPWPPLSGPRTRACASACVHHEQALSGFSLCAHAWCVCRALYHTELADTLQKSSGCSEQLQAVESEDSRL